MPIQGDIVTYCPGQNQIFAQSAKALSDELEFSKKRSVSRVYKKSSIDLKLVSPVNPAHYKQPLRTRGGDNFDKLSSLPDIRQSHNELPSSKTNYDFIARSIYFKES